MTDGNDNGNEQPDRAQEPTHSNGELQLSDRELERRVRETPLPRVSAWLITIAGVALLVSLYGNFRSSAEANSRVAAAGITDLRIHSGSTRVEVETGDVDEIEISLNGNTRGTELNVDRSGSTLEVRVERNWWSFSLINLRGTTLQVTLPDDLQPALDLRGSSGRVSLKDLTLREVHLEVSSGRLCMHDLAVTGNLTARTSSGRVCLQDSVVGGTADISTASGTVSIGGTVAEEFLLASSSGRIQASDLPGRPVTARSSSGRIELEAEDFTDDWDLQSNSGGITVTLESVPDDITVDFQGSSGSIRVDDRYGPNLSSASGNRLQASRGRGGPVLHVQTSSGGFRLN